MRNEALTSLMREQRESITIDIEACELMKVEYGDDTQTCDALSAIQAKYEAVAYELDTQIEKLR